MVMSIYKNLSNFHIVIKLLGIKWLDLGCKNEVILN